MSMIDDVCCKSFFFANHHSPLCVEFTALFDITEGSEAGSVYRDNLPG
jgi:hypothetical protein